MGKVIVHVTMSLDGFIAGPHDEMDWVFQLHFSEKIANDVKDTTGAIVLGKRTFAVSMANGHTPYDGTVKVPMFVVAHKAQEPITKDGVMFTFTTEGVIQAVTQAKQAAKGKNVVLLGASIDQQCLKAGIVDEMVIHLAPILLCNGIRLFDHLGGNHIMLRRIEADTTTEVTDLRFKVLPKK